MGESIWATEILKSKVPNKQNQKCRITQILKFLTNPTGYSGFLHSRFSVSDHNAHTSCCFIGANQLFKVKKKNKEFIGERELGNKVTNSQCEFNVENVNSESQTYSKEKRKHCCEGTELGVYFLDAIA